MIDLDILTISPNMTFSMTILSYQRQRAQYFVACHGIVGFHLYPFGPAPLPSYHGHHQSCSLSHQQSALLTINTSFKALTSPPLRLLTINTSFKAPPTSSYASDPFSKPQPSLYILSIVGSCVSSTPYKFQK